MDEFWRYLPWMLSVVLGLFAVRGTIKFDVNKWQKFRTDRDKNAQATIDELTETKEKLEATEKHYNEFIDAVNELSDRISKQQSNQTSQLSDLKEALKVSNQSTDKAVAQRDQLIKELIKIKVAAGERDSMKISDEIIKILDQSQD